MSMCPERDPWFADWARWCWRKPVYIGLPLSLLALIVAVVDLLYLVLYWWPKQWGKSD